MVRLSLNESDWLKSIKYWNQLTKGVFVSQDDQEKVDFLNKVIFKLPMDNENETKQENDTGKWSGKAILDSARNRVWQALKDVSTTTNKIDPIIKKFIDEPVE